MAQVAAITAVAGAGLNTFGKLQEAETNALLKERDARAKAIQGQEIIARSKINTAALRREAAATESSLQVQVTGAGLQLKGSPLLALEGAQRQIRDEIFLARRDAAFRVHQLREGAKLDVQIAKEIRRTKPLTILGGGLSAASSLGKFSGGAKAPQSLSAPTGASTNLAGDPVSQGRIGRIA